MFRKVYNKLVAFFNNVLCFFISIIIILLNIKVIFNAEILVYMSEGGFGHTVTAPDIQRRLFPGRDNVIIFFSEFGRHNRIISKIFDEIKIIFLPLTVGVKIFSFSVKFPRSMFYKEKGFNAVISFVTFLNKKACIMSMHELYASLPSVESLPQKEQPSWLSEGLEWPLRYFNILKTRPAKKVRLPQGIVKKIESHIEKYRKRYCQSAYERRKVCAFYLRQKGTNKDLSSSLRSGSSINEYLEGFKLLISKGYNIYLRGDIDLPDAVVEELSPFILSYKQLGISKNLFELYAATESDIGINETGGGAWFSPVNSQPSLCLNGFPFGYGLPFSTVMYKNLYNKEGRLVPYIEIFEKYKMIYEFSEYTLRNNSSSEIYTAIKYFLASLNNSSDKNENLKSDAVLSDFTWLKQSGARISPAWYENYKGEKNE